LKKHLIDLRKKQYRAEIRDVNKAHSRRGRRI